MLATFCHRKQPTLEGITFAKDFLFVGLFVCFFLNENETKGSSEGFYQPFLRFQVRLWVYFDRLAACVVCL